jgi:hypothetical protein
MGFFGAGKVGVTPVEYKYSETVLVTMSILPECPMPGRVGGLGR